MDKSDNTISTFDKYADEYQEKYMEYEPYVESYRHLSSLLAADAKVLDVACGPGNISKFLLKEKPLLEILGIDLSPQMVSLARANAPAATFEILDSRNISTLEQQFDAIVCAFCIPYLAREEVAKFILDARAIIGTGGVFYISTMEGQYENSGYQSEDDTDQIYTYFYSCEYLISLLNEHGFDIEHVERKPFTMKDAQSATDLFIYARAH